MSEYLEKREANNSSGEREVQRKPEKVYNKEEYENKAINDTLKHNDTNTHWNTPGSKIVQTTTTIVGSGIRWETQNTRERIHCKWKKRKNKKLVGCIV